MELPLDIFGTFFDLLFKIDQKLQILLIVRLVCEILDQLD
jgi:hypothetical protein